MDWLKRYQEGANMICARPVIVSASIFAAVMFANPVQASATHKLGHAVAAGVGVGVGLGIIGAIVAPRYVAPVYQQPRRIYVQPEPVYEETCYRQRVWAPDGYGGQVQVIRTICE